MNKFVTAIVVIAIIVNLSLANADSQTDVGSAAEQYATLLREYRPISVGMREAKTDLQRKAAVENLGKFPIRFVQLAKKHADDPIALVILRQAIQIANSTDSAAQIAWETNSSDFPRGVSSDAVVQIVAILMRDHVASDNIGPIIDRIRYGYRMEYEEFLVAVPKDNPRRDTRGLACISLGQFLNDKLQLVQLADDRPELAKCYELALGEKFLPRLQRLDRGALANRIEALFKRAAEEFGDVKMPGGAAVGTRAMSELSDIRRLAIGMFAPDIKGKDQDGQQFKLSDYRGKVVLLYFWMEF
ncbi:MAG: hypothetical protein ACI9G1_003111 [Pirellulaceae bacterium]|jgi:hypothetical protein